MIIVGDIACPTEALSKQLKNVLESNEAIFKDQSIILNLEGLFGEEKLLVATVPVLYNHATVLNSFASFSSVTACLANNHILDLPERFNATIELLKRAQVKYVGAGKSFEEAHAPVKCKDGNHEVILFNECWDFLLYHQKNPCDGLHVATIQFHHLAQRVKECKAENPQACIIIYLHWSLDFETLPYPMYRQFSKALIDAGATVVAGCHAHCVQGGEQYKDGYIVYGLGNFFLPNHVFANGKLFFPSFAATQLLFEYKPGTKEAFCHWFQYEEQDGQHHLKHLESSPFQSSLLKKYSPYQQMEQKEYIHVFKKNRRKKMLIPLFKDYQNEHKLKTLTTLLKTRAIFARMMAKLNLIKWGS
jgi:hypothetical protein